MSDKQLNSQYLSNDQILRGPAVQAMTGLSRSTIYRLETKKNQFPKRVKLGERACGWRLSDVQAWIETRKQANSEA